MFVIMNQYHMRAKAKAKIWQLLNFAFIISLLSIQLPFFSFLGQELPLFPIFILELISSFCCYYNNLSAVGLSSGDCRSG